MIDVLRFTSTLTTALANGALWAETFADPEKALAKRDEGYIVAGEDCATNIPGIFVAGDIRTKSTRQLVTAASDGAVAVNSALAYRRNNV